MRRSLEQGFTLLELMVSMVITSIVFLAAMQTYTTMVRVAHDHRIRLETHVQAQAVMQTVGSEIRILGNGVPFDQANFQIGEATLSDPTVTEPIIVSTATTSLLSFRLNETGEVSLLTADFDPTASLVISLTDVSGYAVNDPIYISNSVMSGDDGLYGVVRNVNTGSNTVTIGAGYVTTTGATFEMGSILEEVPIITYASTNGVGITRDSGFGAVLLGGNATMTLDYQDYNGVTLTPPLTNVVVVDSLRSVEVTIALTSESLLKNGSTFTATVSQVFGLRNLNYLY